MTRSCFLQTLAALLAGTHAAGPITPMGLPSAPRRCCPAPRAPSPSDCAAPTAGGCR